MILLFPPNYLFISQLYLSSPPSQLVLHKMDSDSLGNTEVWSLLLSLILHSHSAISTGTLLSFISRLLSNHPDR